DTAGDVHKYYFNALGQLQWEKDEKGSITYREYESHLALLTKQIIDLDTDSFSPTPPSGYTNSNGLTIETDFTYLSNGKLTQKVDPEGRTEVYHYTYLKVRDDTVAKIWRPVTLSYH